MRFMSGVDMIIEYVCHLQSVSLENKGLAAVRFGNPGVAD